MNDEELRHIVASGRNLNITEYFLEDRNTLIELIKSPIDVVSEIMPDFKKANPIVSNVKYSKEGSGKVITVNGMPGIVINSICLEGKIIAYEMIVGDNKIWKALDQM